jgi:hypothetical protein
VWVRRQGRRVSALDLFENRLALLTGPDGAFWRPAAAGVEAAPVEVFVPGEDLTDPGGALARAYRQGLASAVLVRPDGIVVWRHDGRCSDPRAALANAVDVALGRRVAAIQPALAS